MFVILLCKAVMFLKAFPKSMDGMRQIIIVIGNHNNFTVKLNLTTSKL